MATRTKVRYTVTTDGYRFEYQQRTNKVLVFDAKEPGKPSFTSFTPAKIDTEVDFQHEVSWFLFDNNALAN